MKTCGKCGESKGPERFYKRAASVDGLAACCKRCQWLYDLKRLNAPHRVAARAAHAKKNQRLISGFKAAWASRNPDKRRAHIIVNNAIRDGKLVRSTLCARCETIGRLQAHHDDYSKPLEVTWLCQPCHYEEHRTERLQKKLLELS